jgi:hypothetical protein
MTVKGAQAKGGQRVGERRGRGRAAIILKHSERRNNSVSTEGRG